MNCVVLYCMSLKNKNKQTNKPLTEGALAGVYLHASSFEFPAAMTTTTPALTQFSTASSTISYAGPPRDKDAILLPDSRAT